MNKERITLHMTTIDAIVALAEGNPGATVAMTELMKSAATIDPEHMLGALAPLLMLDSFGIYGSHIWMVYKDICNHDVTKTLAVIRALQLGIIRKNQLNLDDNNRAHLTNITLDELYAQVCAELPEFGKAPV